ncbi:MAG: apolipoprotein N-acyltransferase [bacterium]|nr:apolipoprotein N-acyltransferase [bacterium]
MPKKRGMKISRFPFIVSGLLTALAYPPLNLWLIAWFSLVPLLWKARNLTFWMAFRRGWWGGLIFNAVLLYWIALNSGTDHFTAIASCLGLVLVLSLYWALFTAVWSFLFRRWGILGALFLPAVWVGLEVVKNAPEIAFPWLELGLTQIQLLPVAQLAELGGIRFVSAWVLSANVMILLLWQGKRTAGFTVLTLLLFGGIWGWYRIYHLPPAGPRITAVIVQGNVDPSVKWHEDPDSSLSVYIALTSQALQSDSADIVVWPETAVPVYLAHQMKYQMQLRKLASNSHTAILTGALHYEFDSNAKHNPRRFNSAFFFPENGSPPLRYDKISLVPFGERVPFQKWFPRLGELNFGQAEFTAGNHYSVFDLGRNVKVSAQICYESVFGDQTRRFVLEGARVLCNLTNDGWYGRSAGPYQHAALVRFSCIETRCPLLRAANTGISLVADRSGRIVKSLPLLSRGTLWAQVESGGNAPTFYVKHGEIIPIALLLLGCASVILSFGRKPKEMIDR